MSIQSHDHDEFRRQLVTNAGHVEAGSANPKGIWPKDAVSFDSLTKFRRTVFYPLLESKAKDGQVTILDLGCGNGTKTLPILIRLAELGSKVSATMVDFQPDAIKDARSMAERLNVPTSVQMEFIVLDVVDYIPKRSEYDCVLLDNLLHFINPKDTDTLLTGIKKGLKQDGFIFGVVCSIYNAACIKMSDSEKLAKSIAHTKGPNRER